MAIKKHYIGYQDISIASGQIQSSGNLAVGLNLRDKYIYALVTHVVQNNNSSWLAADIGSRQNIVFTVGLPTNPSTNEDNVNWLGVQPNTIKFPRPMQFTSNASQSISSYVWLEVANGSAGAQEFRMSYTVYYSDNANEMDNQESRELLASL